MPVEERSSLAKLQMSWTFLSENLPLVLYVQPALIREGSSWA